MYTLGYHMLLCICLAPADDDDDSAPRDALSESECNVHYI